MAENNFNYGDSLISAGANLMGAAIGAGVGVAQSKKQWKYQKKAMELQQKYNIQNWEMQNEYNTPSAQLERLEAAGINPLTQDGGFANTSGDISAAGLPSISAPDFSSVPEGIMKMGESLQYAYEGYKLEQEDRKINLDRDRLYNETQTMLATVRNLNMRSDLTAEEIETQKVTRDQIAQNILVMKSDIERKQVQNQKDIIDAAATIMQTEIDRAYKAGMIDIEGQRNDIAREGNRLKQEELDNDMKKFKEDIALRTNQYNLAVQKQQYDQIEQAISHLKYESTHGFITGVKRESLLEMQALLNVIPNINADDIINQLPYTRNKSRETSTMYDATEHATDEVVAKPIQGAKEVLTNPSGLPSLYLWFLYKQKEILHQMTSSAE